MIRNQKILFRCDQNILSGFGHFSRCLNLARAIKNEGNRQVTFIGNYDLFALKLLNEYRINFFEISSVDFSYFNYNLFNEYTHIVVDSYLFKQDFIDKITKLSLHTIFIDDTGQLNFTKADLVINFRVGAETFKYDSKLVALGPSYFIYKNELEFVRENRLIRKDVKKILLFFGGVNNLSEIIKLIIEIIQNLNPKIEITLITKDFNDFDDKKYDSIIKHLPTFDIENYYENADLVINGGGLTKYECCYCLIPSASISTTQLQYEDSLILEKNSLLCNLGYLKDLNLDFLKTKIVSFINNAEERNLLIEASKKSFKKKSLNKLITLFNKL